MQVFRDEIESIDNDILRLQEKRLKNVDEIQKIKNASGEKSFLPLIEFEKRKKALQFYGDEALELICFLMGQARARQVSIVVLTEKKNLSLANKLLGPFCEFVLTQEKKPELINYFLFTENSAKYKLNLQCKWVLVEYHGDKEQSIYPII